MLEVAAPGAHFLFFNVACAELRGAQADELHGVTGQALKAKMLSQMFGRAVATVWSSDILVEELCFEYYAVCGLEWKRARFAANQCENSKHTRTDTPCHDRFPPNIVPHCEPQGRFVF